jgi:hypothetical protein
VHLAVEGIIDHRRAEQQRIPDIRYERSKGRNIRRRIQGAPDDRPTRDELVGTVESRIRGSH